MKKLLGGKHGSDLLVFGVIAFVGFKLMGFVKNQQVAGVGKHQII